MTLAIEPMLNIGGDETKELETAGRSMTRDRALSAHFEHTIVITRTGARKS